MRYINKNQSDQGWLHFIRSEEANMVLKYFPEGENLKILEIGGGDGYIASIFSDNGYAVTSIDIKPRFPQSFPVQKVSRSKLAFPDKTFDIIFSSNVLEHVVELDVLLKETKRVAKKDAIMIHVMPTPVWRLITSFWYVLRVTKTIFMKLTVFHKKNETNQNDNESFYINNESEKRQTLGMKLKRILLHPHGEYPSFIHEFYYFSKIRWRNIFKTNEFECLHVYRCPLIYSGESVFKFRFIPLRKYIANNIFSAGYIFILNSR